MAPAASAAAAGKNSPAANLESSKNKKKEKKEKKEKPVNEIEEIFRAAKGKKKRKESSSSSSSAAVSTEGGSNLESRNLMKTKIKTKKEKTPKKPAAGEELGSSRKRRKTGDGLTIYSAEELGFGNPDAGGTPLCPFDCSCCF